MRWPSFDRSARRRAIAGASGLRQVATRAVGARRPGQAAVEAGLTALISIMTILVTLQLSLVIAQAFSAMYVAQTTARWLAVRIDTIDTDVKNQAVTFAAGLPGMSGGGLTTSGVTVAASCAALDGTGKCASRDSGDAVTVSVTTNLSAVVFLGAAGGTFGVPPFQFQLPATMPTISYTVLLE
jgi:hypothetical protein